MSQKLIIAKPGFDALTETDPNNLIFSSDYNTLKYYASGSTVVNWVDDGALYQSILAHNLGYIPFFQAYVPAGGSTSNYNTLPNNQQTIAGQNYQSVYADATNLYFAVKQDQGTGLSHSTTFAWKIFRNRMGF